jgi:hypothetical protein
MAVLMLCDTLERDDDGLTYITVNRLSKETQRSHRGTTTLTFQCKMQI